VAAGWDEEQLSPGETEDLLERLAAQSGLDGPLTFDAVHVVHFQERTELRFNSLVEVRSWILAVVVLDATKSRHRGEVEVEIAGERRVLSLIEAHFIPPT